MQFLCRPGEKTGSRVTLTLERKTRIKLMGISAASELISSVRGKPRSLAHSLTGKGGKSALSHCARSTFFVCATLDLVRACCPRRWRRLRFDEKGSKAASVRIPQRVSALETFTLWPMTAKHDLGERARARASIIAFLGGHH